MLLVPWENFSFSGNYHIIRMLGNEQFRAIRNTQLLRTAVQNQLYAWDSAQPSEITCQWISEKKQMIFTGHMYRNKMFAKLSRQSICNLPCLVILQLVCHFSSYPLRSLYHFWRPFFPVFIPFFLLPITIKELILIIYWRKASTSRIDQCSSEVVSSSSHLLNAIPSPAVIFLELITVSPSYKFPMIPPETSE